MYIYIVRWKENSSEFRYFSPKPSYQHTWTLVQSISDIHRTGDSIQLCRPKDLCCFSEYP